MLGLVSKRPNLNNSRNSPSSVRIKKPNCSVRLLRNNRQFLRKSEAIGKPWLCLDSALLFYKVEQLQDHHRRRQECTPTL